ncbi:hypothetical protein WR25_16784 [Diploscapter pachys]|uniref:Polypeptide-transport-associated ShlB-type domain-containing protein n=1 Tax=Diploscapter pachys TaxID=2018661 RepID=A0A2A2M212_9BILA|nr:hypothetical protein WR25_16784 [Diploscapter pachys]
MRRLLLTMLGLSAACLARGEPLPSFLNSNETERRLPTPNLPVDAYRPDQPGLRVPSVDTARQPPLLMSTPVAVRKVRFEGGTVYPLSDLREHYQPVIGREVTLAELIEITRRLTQRYQQDGYLLSYAYLPPQDFADGRVRVVLVEGYIHDYHIEGDIGAARAYLVQLLDRLKAERPLTRESFERYTSLVGRIPGVTFQAQVPPPATTDGATRLLAQVSRKPVTTTLSLNDGSRDDLQALLGASSNAQTHFAEQLSASVLPVPRCRRLETVVVGFALPQRSQGAHSSGQRHRPDPAPRERTLLGGHQPIADRLAQ